MLRNTRRTRWGSAALILIGSAIYLGLRTLFLDHWIAVTMYGAVTWVAVGCYIGIAMVVAGAALLLASFFWRSGSRPPRSPA